MFIAPFLYVGIWYRSWVVLAAVIAWTVINPFIFPEPKGVSSWFSRVVLGERAC